MSCEICGRGSCTRSFHSCEEQQSFDSVADKIKSRTGAVIRNSINRLGGEWINDEYYIKLDSALECCDIF